jgi:lipoprotein-anchoring transpeptidase ErfK/SrfK
VTRPSRDRTLLTEAPEGPTVTRTPLRPLLALAVGVSVMLPLAPAWAQPASAPPSPAATASAATALADPASAPARPATAPAPAGPTTAPAPTGPATAPAPATPVPAPAPPAAAPAPPPAGPLTARVSASAALVDGSTAVTVATRVVRGDGRPVAGHPVQFLSRTPGAASAVVVGTGTTRADGLASVRVTPRTSAVYSVRAASPLTSAEVVVQVRPRLTSAVVRSPVALGGTGRLHGQLSPAYLGARVQLQRQFPDGGWRGVATVAPDRSGSWSWEVRPGVPGRFVFRAVLPAAPTHLQATSPVVALTVSAPVARDLRQGDRGPEVAALERRLAALKGDVGRLDGVFDGDLRHAVTAFQKTQGLPRSGVADAATRARMASPAPVRLRAPARGRAVEVDLTRQVLYLSQGGALQRVVDVSTGNNALYTVDGVTERAVTPRGRFRIERKIDGVRVSRLGQLYRPAYFHRGWAIHGSPSVPPYPASHGCVRVTNAAMDRLYPLLTLGTPVTVYAS